jgi:hypothetical protein
VVKDVVDEVWKAVGVHDEESWYGGMLKQKIENRDALKTPQVSMVCWSWPNGCNTSWLYSPNQSRSPNATKCHIVCECLSIFT